MNSHIFPHGQPAAFFVFNDVQKSDPKTKEFLQKYKPHILQLYKKIYATDGTGKELAEYGIEARTVGHGPVRGDHNVVQKLLKRQDAGKTSHLFFFRDPFLERHERGKDHLTWMAVLNGIVVFLNSETASVYLDQAIQAHERFRHGTASLIEPIVDRRLHLLLSEFARYALSTNHDLFTTGV